MILGKLWQQMDFAAIRLQIVAAVTMLARTGNRRHVHISFNSADPDSDNQKHYRYKYVHILFWQQQFPTVSCTCL